MNNATFKVIDHIRDTLILHHPPFNITSNYRRSVPSPISTHEHFFAHSFLCCSMKNCTQQEIKTKEERNFLSAMWNFIQKRDDKFHLNDVISLLLL